MNQKSILIVMSRIISAVVTIIALAAAFTPSVGAQDSVTGSVEGTVVDSVTNDPIVGALVRIVNEDTKVPIIALTDTAGRFRKGLLAPGDYKFSFSAKGYRPRETSGFVFVMRTTVVLPGTVALDPEKPSENLNPNSGGIAVASAPNAQVEVIPVDDNKWKRMFIRVIPSDQLLCVFDGLPPRTYQVTATLEGYQPARTQVTVLARKTLPVTLTLVLSESSERIRAQAGKYYALIIGNNAYQYLDPLRTAENDAKMLEAILRERYGFETRLLLNANRSQVMIALNEYRRKAEENSNLLIYYAGHGYNDREVEKTYWLPVDAGREDNANWISADDITINIKGIRARHVLVVSDSCYSGTLARGAEILGASSAEPTERDKYLLKLNASKSRMLMASGGDEPVADSGGGGNSVFAKALLTGLTKMDRDIFLGTDLYLNFVAQVVSGKSNQTPEYSAIRNSGHESGDFIFIRKKQ